MKMPRTPKRFVLVFCLTLALNTNATTAQQQGTRESVDLNKCPGSKLNAGQEILVPSYAFNSKIILRVKKINFTSIFNGCKTAQGRPQDLTATNLFYLPGEQSELDPKEVNEIESEATTIRPTGILNVRNHFYRPSEYCIMDYSPAINSTEVPSLEIQYCGQDCSTSEKTGSQLCLRKCCDPGKVIDLNGGGENQSYRCKPSGNKSWTGLFYDEHSRKRISEDREKVLVQNTHYFKEIVPTLCNDQFETWVMKKLPNRIRTMMRLLTNGQLIYIGPHRRWELLESQHQFCMDGIQNFGGPSFDYTGDEEDQMIFLCTEKLKPEERASLSLLYMYSLFFAAGFYFVTAVIYILLWDKQNTNGWTSLSLVVSQFFMCVLVGNAHRLGRYGDSDTRNSSGCIANAILAHFFMLASFSWLTVINFDLWSTFRALKSRNHVRVDLKKFALYSLLGWGAPLTVVIIGVILDHLYPDRESLVIVPEYGSNICYVVPWAQGAYVYYVIAALLGIIVTLSALTCFKIYQYTMDTAGARSSSSAGDRKIFILYAKLSVVLGTSWIFEFVSWVSSSEENQHWIWVILDMYNLLTAFFIFVIFGCKRTNFTQLAEKYSGLSFMKPMNDIVTKWMARSQGDATGSSIVPPSAGGQSQEMKKYGSTTESHSK